MDYDPKRRTVHTCGDDLRGCTCAEDEEIAALRAQLALAERVVEAFRDEYEPHRSPEVFPSWTTAKALAAYDAQKAKP